MIIYLLSSFSSRGERTRRAVRPRCRPSLARARHSHIFGTLTVLIGVIRWSRAECIKPCFFHSFSFFLFLLASRPPLIIHCPRRSLTRYTVRVPACHHYACIHLSQQAVLVLFCFYFFFIFGRQLRKTLRHTVYTCASTGAVTFGILVFRARTEVFKTAIVQRPELSCTVKGLYQTTRADADWQMKNAGWCIRTFRGQYLVFYKAKYFYRHLYIISC